MVLNEEDAKVAEAVNNALPQIGAVREARQHGLLTGCMTRNPADGIVVLTQRSALENENAFGFFLAHIGLLIWVQM